MRSDDGYFGLRRSLAGILPCMSIIRITVDLLLLRTTRLSVNTGSLTGGLNQCRPCDEWGRENMLEC